MEKTGHLVTRLTIILPTAKEPHQSTRWEGGKTLYITFGVLVQHRVNLSRVNTWLDISVTKKQTETEKGKNLNTSFCPHLKLSSS